MISNEDSKRVLCRAFTGGSGGQQLTALKTGYAKLHLELSRTGIHLVLETIGNSDIRQSEKTSLQDVINWLLEADFHVFTCQGMHLNMGGCDGWTVENIYGDAIFDLVEHPGIPFGIGFQNPIFQGNKWGYLQHIEEYILPTFPISLPYNEEDRQQVRW